MRTFAAAVVVALALGLTPASGAAQESPKAQAKRYFKEGKVLFNLGKFPAAIQEFERSYRLYDAPEILFMIGQCHNHMGHHRRAIYFYRRYLAEKPGASNAAAIEQMIAGLEAKVAATAPKPAPTPAPPVKPTPPVTPKPVAKAPAVPPPAPAAPRAAAPPPPILPPPRATDQPTPALDLRAERRPADEPTPIYRKWWFWGGVGAAVVTVVVVSTVLATGGGAPSGGAGTIDCSDPGRGCVVLSMGR